MAWYQRAYRIVRALSATRKDAQKTIRPAGELRIFHRNGVSPSYPISPKNADIPGSPRCNAIKPTLTIGTHRTSVGRGSVAAQLKGTASAQLKWTMRDPVMMGKKYPLRTVPMTAHNG